jgi:hypothetical protein
VITEEFTDDQYLFKCGEYEMKNIATVISASLLVVASVSVSAYGWGPDNGYGYGYAPPYGYAPYGYGVPVQPPAQPTEEQIKAMQEQQVKAFEYMQNVQRQMAQYYANNPDPIASMERSMFEQRNAHMQEMNKLIQETNQDINRNIQESMSQRPMYGAEPALPEDLTARKQEMEKQAEEYRKAAEERRASFMKAQESMSQHPIYGAEPTLPEDLTARKQEMEKQAQDYRKVAEERRAAFMKAAEQRRLDAEKRFEERKTQRNSMVAPVVDAPKADTSSDDAKKI